MAIDCEKDGLEKIKSSFTSEEKAEFNRRQRIVLVLLSRIAPTCAELGELIEERARDIRSGKLSINVAYVAGAVIGLLIWLKLLSYKLLLLPGFVIGWTVLWNVINLNGPRILGLRQIVTPMIVRIEELGVSETAVFLYVRKAAGIKDEIIQEFREMYHASDHDPDSDLSQIGVFLADDDGEYDWEVVEDEGLDAILTRIRVQLAKSVLADSKS